MSFAILFVIRHQKRVTRVYIIPKRGRRHLTLKYMLSLASILPWRDSIQRISLFWKGECKLSIKLINHIIGGWVLPIILPNSMLWDCFAMKFKSIKNYRGKMEILSQNFTRQLKQSFVKTRLISNWVNYLMSIHTNRTLQK